MAVEKVELEIQSKLIKGQIDSLVKEFGRLSKEIGKSVTDIKTKPAFDEFEKEAGEVVARVKELALQMGNLAKEKNASAALKKAAADAGVASTSIEKIAKSFSELPARAVAGAKGAAVAANATKEGLDKILESVVKVTAAVPKLAVKGAEDVRQAFAGASAKTESLISAGEARLNLVVKRGAGERLSTVQKFLRQKDDLEIQAARTATKQAEAEAKAVAAVKRQQNYLALAEYKARARDETALLREQIANRRRLLDGFGTSLRGAVSGFLRAAVLPVTASAAIAGAIKTMAEFDLKITEAALASGNAALALDKFSDAAIRVASTTVFTTSQAAEALLTLSRAGFRTNEAIEVLEPTLNLATAAGVQLSVAADVMSTTIRAFGIEASEAAKVADVLAAAANQSNTDVRGLAEGFKFAAPAARAVGLTLTETAAVLGTLSDNGIKGSLAGTALRSVISNLINPSDKARAAIQGMGLGLADVDIQARGLLPVLQTLAERQLNAVEAFAIFEERGGPGILALTSNISRLQLLNDVIQLQAGYAKDSAFRIQNTLGGALKTIPAVASAAGASLGKDGLNGILTGLVQAFTGAGREGSLFSTVFGSGLKYLAGAVAAFSGGVLVAISNMAKVAGQAFPLLKGKFSEVAAAAENSAATISDSLATAFSGLEDQIPPLRNEFDAAADELDRLANRADAVADRFDVDLPDGMERTRVSARETQKELEGLQKALEVLRGVEDKAIQSEKKSADERDKLVERRKELRDKAILEIAEVNELGDSSAQIDKLESDIDKAKALREEASRAVTRQEEALLRQASAANAAAEEVSALSSIVGASTSSATSYADEINAAADALSRLGGAASGVSSEDLDPDAAIARRAPKGGARVNEDGTVDIVAGGGVAAVQKRFLDRQAAEGNRISPPTEALRDEIREEMREQAEKDAKRGGGSRGRAPNLPALPDFSPQPGNRATPRSAFDERLQAARLIQAERSGFGPAPPSFGVGRALGGPAGPAQRGGVEGALPQGLLDRIDSFDSLGLLGEGGIFRKALYGDEGPDALLAELVEKRGAAEEIIVGGGPPSPQVGGLQRLDETTSEIRRPGDRTGAPDELKETTPALRQALDGFEEPKPGERPEAQTETEIISLRDELERMRQESAAAKDELAELAKPLGDGEFQKGLDNIGTALDGTASSAEKLAEAQRLIDSSQGNYNETIEVTNQGLSDLSDAQEKSLDAGKAVLENTEANSQALEGLRQRSGGVAFEYTSLAEAMKNAEVAQRDGTAATVEAAAATEQSNLVWDEATRTLTNIKAPAEEAAAAVTETADAAGKLAADAAKVDSTVTDAAAGLSEMLSVSEKLTLKIGELGEAIRRELAGPDTISAIRSILEALDSGGDGNKGGGRI